MLGLSRQKPAALCCRTVLMALRVTCGSVPAVRRRACVTAGTARVPHSERRRYPRSARSRLRRSTLCSTRFQSISPLKCSTSVSRARLKPRRRNSRNSLAAYSFGGGVKPAGRNTGPDWQIFSMAKRSDEAQTADLRHSNLRTAPALLSPCKKRRRLKRRRKDSP